MGLGERLEAAFVVDSLCRMQGWKYHMQVLPQALLRSATGQQTPIAADEQHWFLRLTLRLEQNPLRSTLVIDCMV